MDTTACGESDIGVLVDRVVEPSVDTSGEELDELDAETMSLVRLSGAGTGGEDQDYMRWKWKQKARRVE